LELLKYRDTGRKVNSHRLEEKTPHPVSGMGRLRAEEPESGHGNLVRHDAAANEQAAGERSLVHGCLISHAGSEEMGPAIRAPD
jgi:hypothetical protein